MSYQLSDSTIKEIQDFYHRDFISRDNLTWKIRTITDQLLKACDFVYVAEKGSVIHASYSCGAGFNTLVPIDIALKYGYNRPCKACASGTYVEDLITYSQNKSGEKSSLKSNSADVNNA